MPNTISLEAGGLAELEAEVEAYLAFWAEAGPGRIPFRDETAREAELAETIGRLNRAAELEPAERGEN